ncbi:MAG TPA: YtxH domain-containing protein [Pyrinomonadaceae bacterium]|jgi:gas vesicle protein
MRHEYERDEPSATTKLTYLVVGGGIGAVLALLFAPKSGTELRGDIADATRKGLEKGKETAALVGEKAGDYYEVTRERAGELYHSAQEKAGELSEKARQAASRSTTPFSAAIEAGKDAYAEEKRRTESRAIIEGRPSYPVDNRIESTSENRTENRIENRTENRTENRNENKEG